MTANIFEVAYQNSTRDLQGVLRKIFRTGAAYKESFKKYISL